MDVMVRFVIVPLAFASFVTGVVSSLATHWGLFRHYWVVVKLLVTVAATAVLVLQLGTVELLATAAVEDRLSEGDLQQGRMSLVVHSGGGLLVLLGPTILGVYKPRGVTPYGARRGPRVG